MLKGLLLYSPVFLRSLWFVPLSTRRTSCPFTNPTMWDQRLLHRCILSSAKWLILQLSILLPLLAVTHILWVRNGAFHFVIVNNCVQMAFELIHNTEKVRFSKIPLTSQKINLLKTKRNLLYIRNQTVPHSKHFPSWL